MLQDGKWCQDGGGWTLILGTIFTGRIYPRPGNRGWHAVLNGKEVTTCGELAYAQGLIERMIVDELARIVPAYRLIKQRVPSAEAIWGCDGWAKWKREQARREVSER